MRQLLFVDVLIVLIGLVGADPAPAPAPSKTLDQLLSDLASQRKAKEDAAKAEADTVAAIKALLASESAKAAAAGITIEPPAPVDPLTATIQAAYTADPSVGKASDARTLATTYRQIASQIDGIATTQALAQTVASLTKSQLSGRLATVTLAFGKDFVGHIPAGSVDLTDANKKEVAATLIRYAAILEGLK